TFSRSARESSCACWTKREVSSTILTRVQAFHEIVEALPDQEESLFGLLKFPLHHVCQPGEHLTPGWPSNAKYDFSTRRGCNRKVIGRDLSRRALPLKIQVVIIRLADHTVKYFNGSRFPGGVRKIEVDSTLS